LLSCPVISQSAFRIPKSAIGKRYGWVPGDDAFTADLREKQPWLRVLHGKSVTELEILHGVLNHPELAGLAFFYFRDPQATAAMVEPSPGDFREPPGSAAERKLQQLKQAITDAGLKPFPYPAEWNADQARLTKLEPFGKQVFDDLLHSIQTDPDLQDRFESSPTARPDELDEERAAMEAFIEERTQRYVVGSRQGVLDELHRFALDAGDARLLVVAGASGTGKSALLARFCQELADAAATRRHTALVISHFVGASAGSTDLHRVLRRLCHEIYAACDLEQDKRARLAEIERDVQERLSNLVHSDNETKEAIRKEADQGRRDIESEYEIPHHPEKLGRQLPSFLEKAARKGRAVLVLDALNQLDQTLDAHSLHWLPTDLPANVRVVASVLAEETPPDSAAPPSAAARVLANLSRRTDSARTLRLEPLGTADREAIIRGYLERYQKRMSDQQVASLLAKPDSGLPLYLLVALEELRTLGTHDEISARIAELPGDTRRLFRWVLKRLEQDPGLADARGQPVGATLVRFACALLGVSRSGLSHAELVTLVAPGDPQGNVAALLRLLGAYLMRRGELLDFFHGQFRQAVAEEYLRNDTERGAAHNELADYFRSQADPGKDRSWKSSAARPFLELTGHLHNAGRDSELRSLLLGSEWLQKKLEAADVLALIADYDHLPRDVELGLVQGAIRLSSHVIGPEKNQLASQLVGRLVGETTPQIQQLVASICAWRGAPWLRPLHGNLHPPGTALLRTLQGYAGGVGAVALSADGRRAVSGSSDHTLKVWDVESGRELRALARIFHAPVEQRGGGSVGKLENPELYADALHRLSQDRL
jgi:Cdc6-like AAA superfamily ATPase